MEILKWLLLIISSVLETGVIFYLCNVIGKMQIKFIDVLVISFITFIIFYLQIPFARQLCLASISVVYFKIRYKENILKSLTFIIFGMTYLLFFEVILGLFFDIFTSINIVELNHIYRLLILIPIRILQYFILYSIRRISHGNDLVRSD